MLFEIRGKQIKVTKSIETYIKEKINKMDKYFSNPESLKVQVLIKVKNQDQIIEVTIYTKEFTIRAEERNQNLYASIDLVSDKIERQIRKNKTKLNKIDKDKTKEFVLNYESEEVEEYSKIIKRKKIDSKPMNEDEAILQMEMLDHDFFLYKDSKDMSFKLIYKRKDGNYGLIETN